MNIPSCKWQDDITNGEEVVECQHCGDLYEFKIFSIPSGKSIALTSSPFFNLVMMVSGTANITNRQSNFELKMGQVWLASSDESFRLGNIHKNQDAVVICVGVRAAMLSRFYERYDNALLHKKQAPNMMKSVLPRGKAPFIFPSCELTKLTLDSFRLFGQLDNDGLNALKLEELLLLKLNSDHGKMLANELLNQVNPEQEAFRRFMETNITNNWSLADYAKQIGMSLTSFKNMFSLVFRGSSPKSWINERRLRYADVQLHTTSKRLVDIALESGFSSQSYFTQLYKSKYRISPSLVRKECVSWV